MSLLSDAGAIVAAGTLGIGLGVGLAVGALLWRWFTRSAGDD